MSKFFLILSGIMTAVGVAICIIASFMAKSAGVQLFQVKNDGEYVYKVELENTDITKIAVSATNADITIFTDCEKEYIEFINFDDNFFSVSTTNMVVSFNEYVELSSLVSFWDPSFTFKGMRSLLKLGRKIDGKKSVNIYLAKDREIKIFDFTLESGSVNITGGSGATDYRLNVDEGNIKLKDVITSSNVKLSSKNCTLNFENCCIPYFTADAANIQFKGDISDVKTFTLNSKSGEVDVDVAFDGDKSFTTVMSSGNITVNGDYANGGYNNLPEGEEDADKYMSAKITGDSLNVNFDYKNKTNEKPEDTQ